jgi:phage shock protein A
MSVMSRLNRLVRANLNDLTSRVARREVVVEVREGLKEARAQQVQTRIAERRLATEYERLLDESADWERRAELALRSGDEGLARKALLQKHQLDRRADAVKKQLDEERAHLVDLDRTLEAVELKIQGLRDRGVAGAGAGAVAGAPPSATPRAGAMPPSAASGTARTAELEAKAELGLMGSPELFDTFEEMSSRLADSEAEIDALRELSAPEPAQPVTPDMEAAFRRLEADQSLDALRQKQDDLAALRRRLDEE